VPSTKKKGSVAVASDSEEERKMQKKRRRQHKKEKRVRYKSVTENDLLMLDNANTAFANNCNLQKEVQRLRFLRAYK
jgi:hypothetical protein